MVFIPCGLRNRCWTGVRATEKYKVPLAGGNKRAAAIGKGNNKNGMFLRRLWWPKKQLTRKWSLYLPESLILPLVSGNRSTQRSKYNHLQAIYEPEIKVGWWDVKKIWRCEEKKMFICDCCQIQHPTAHRLIALQRKWLHFVIITGFGFQYSLDLHFNAIV